MEKVAPYGKASSKRFGFMGTVVGHYSGISDCFVGWNVSFMDEFDGVGSFDTVPDTLGKSTNFVGHARVPGLGVFFKELFVFKHGSRFSVVDGVCKGTRGCLDGGLSGAMGHWSEVVGVRGRWWGGLALYWIVHPWFWYTVWLNRGVHPWFWYRVGWIGWYGVW